MLTYAASLQPGSSAVGLQAANLGQAHYKERMTTAASAEETKISSRLLFELNITKGKGAHFHKTSVWLKPTQAPPYFTLKNRDKTIK